MSALRRIPLDQPSSNESERERGERSFPLGILRVDLKEIDELISDLKTFGKGVKLYAGEGVAPRGIVDLDDATAAEMQAIKITVRQPYMIIRLGKENASCLHKTTRSGVKAANIVAEFALKNQSWLPPLRPMRLYLIFCLGWILSGLGLKTLPTLSEPGTTSINALISGLVVIAHSAFLAYLVFFTWKLSRQISKSGVASVGKRAMSRWLRAGKGHVLLTGIAVNGPLVLSIAFILIGDLLWF